MPREIEIEEITTTKRTIAIPDVCPECETDLTEEDAIRRHELVDYSGSMTLSETGVRTDTDDDEECGGDPLLHDVACAECGRSFVEEVAHA